MKINRKKVGFSMLIPFFTVFSIIYIVTISEMSTWERSQIFFFEIFAGSSPIWLLSILFCWLLQRKIIKPLSTKRDLRRLLIYETIVASVVSLNAVFGILIIGGLGNILRYQWLIYKDRMYN
jgi:hypothetical protein